MDKEPLEPQQTFHITFDELLMLSMQEWKKRLGFSSNIVDADPVQPEQASQDVKMLQRAIDDNSEKEQ